MRLLLLVYFSSVALSLYGQSRPQPPVDSATLASAAFIGVVRMQQSIQGVTECTIIRSFKVTKPMEDHFILRSEDDLRFNEGDVYLIYAQNAEYNKFYIDKNSRILKEEHSEKDIAYLLSVLPCFNPEAKATRACSRVYRPVCGCDSKTYGNVCEAINSGVVIFSRGECK